MTAIFELSYLGRTILGLWTLLLCLTGIVGAVLSLACRRYRNVIVTLPLFAADYLLWQVTVCCLYQAGQASALYRWLCHLPWLAWAGALGLLTLGEAGFLYAVIRYLRTFITPLSIERCANELSCGICYWQDNGHVIFTNDCMNLICAQLMGSSPMDGKQIRAAITAPIMPVGDRVWQFSFRETEYGGHPLHELIATDVSTVYAESEALRLNNLRLTKMNEDLRVYGTNLDETVRRQEMLQAKVSIHHEMNRLMLSTIAVSLADEQELSRIFALWERNALLLCMESGADQGGDAEELENLAQALGVRLLWERKAPEVLTPKQRELFFAAAREAITNSVKHAGARTMEITFSETPAGLSCTLQNDGTLPTGPIRFTGGLANLELLASQQGAAVSAEARDFFRLCVAFSARKE